MKARNKERLLQIFLYLSLVVIGATVGIAIGNYSDLPLAEEVDILDIATLVVTVFLAVYVPAVLDRRLQTMRDRKTLLEDKVADYQSLLRRINILVQDDHTMPVDALITIANLSDVATHRLATITSLVNNSRFKDALSDDIAAVKKINDQHAALMKNGEKSDVGPGYVREVIGQEEELYNRLDEQTSLLIFKISDQK